MEAVAAETPELEVIREKKLWIQEYVIGKPKAKVKADFVNITLQLGDLHVAFIGKRDGVQSFGAILLQALEKFIDAEIPYSHAEKNDKDIAYG